VGSTEVFTPAKLLVRSSLLRWCNELVSRSDPETLSFSATDIILLVPANPDGQELVSDWYMREADTLKRTTSRLPRLYEKYAGHDNNRDSYMGVAARDAGDGQHSVRAWYPQIMYNHHQTGPIGTVIFAPPSETLSITTFDPTRSRWSWTSSERHALEVRRGR